MRKINQLCGALTLSCISFSANLCSSQTASSNLKNPVRELSTYLSKECGVSFQYPSNMAVVQVPTSETDKDREPDICSLAVQARNPPTKGPQTIPSIRIMRGSLEKVAAGEGLTRDPEHPGFWTFASRNPIGGGEDEKGNNWHRVHASYAVRLFDEQGYQGMGDAEMLIACNGIDRCILFDTEDLGYPTFNQILTTLHLLSAHQ